MTIYTKKGDKGKTGLFKKVNGKSVRVSKSSCNTRAIGAIDEVDSFIGVVISLSHDEYLKERLHQVQNNLLTTGSILAGSDLKIQPSETKKLEKEIDECDKFLPALTNFIFPGGSPIAAYLQYARTLARKAEREVVALNEETRISASILKYINRLSDYLFTLARVENFKLKVKDEVWKK
ncbi:MAG: ATP:cob(I)alamin adenosyltransferase [Candidatus Woesebacteria bacterium GW2011_GWA1_39_21]|uniref:Corrinoid adenosyltransferase n=1 Tax=Candidatus Woesebacteria bacterium GW2011_GWA1_39_21 TaxID=1618550 RepID=A0A0G0N6P4_9BACT|nr:MAG: ATP:cob(I)alamin adenosyltransferase [Candidatus Woesebacteria bacterium GW2011_GWA1_39_21]